jgi:hypothetical protein
MKRRNETPPLTETDIAAMADAAGIALSGARLETVTSLANRFRGNVEPLRAYLATAEKAAPNEPA